MAQLTRFAHHRASSELTDNAKDTPYIVTCNNHSISKMTSGR